MPNKWINAAAFCPYFIYDGDNYIVCDGVIDGCTTRSTFPTVAAKKRHELDFCTAICCYGCPVAQAAELTAEAVIAD